jgi:hypothetical protein
MWQPRRHGLQERKFFGYFFSKKVTSSFLTLSLDLAQTHTFFGKAARFARHYAGLAPCGRILALDIHRLGSE